MADSKTNIYKGMAEVWLLLILGTLNVQNNKINVFLIHANDRYIIMLLFSEIHNALCDFYSWKSHNNMYI